MTRRTDRLFWIDVLPILALEAVNAYLIRRLHRRFRAAG